MARNEKPLLAHPKITQPMRDNLIAWSAEMKRDFTYTPATGPSATLTADEQLWAKKMLAGVEGYLFFAPVIKKISDYGPRPATSKVGMLDTPSTSVAGYQYLKTGDSLVQDDRGRWTRVETWEGSENWDTDIYS